MPASRWPTRPALAGVVLANLASCALPPRDRGLGEIQERLAALGMGPIPWMESGAVERRIAERVDSLTVGDLSEAEAVEVALLNNPGLQATLHRLGLAQADWLGAWLLSNPTLQGAVRFPEGMSGTNLEFNLLQNLLGLLQRSQRIDIADERFQQVVLEVCHAALDLKADARRAYFRVKAAAESVEVVDRQLAHAAATRARAEQSLVAGQLGLLQVVPIRLRHEQAKAMAAQRYGALATARASLDQVLGLWGARTRWTIAPSLPSIPTAPLQLDRLEQLAVARRMDLQALFARCRALAQALQLERDWRWLPGFQAGLGPERAVDGTWLVGPAIRFEIPLFDRNQDSIRRLEAQLAIAEHSLTELAVAVRAEVRAGLAGWVTATRVARHQRDVVLPMHREAAAVARDQLERGAVSATELMAVEVAQFAAEHDRVQRTLDYWLARVELERRLGGPLPRHSGRMGWVLSGRGRSDTPPE